MALVTVQSVSAQAPKVRPMETGTFRVKVEALKVDGRSYSVTLKGSDSAARSSTRSSTSNRADEDTIKFLNHLTEGKEYDFPKVFEDVFGEDYQTAHPKVVQEFGFSSSATLHFGGAFNTPPPPNPFPVVRPMTLFELGKVPKFRAAVVEKSLESVLVVVKLETNYGATLELRHAPGTTEADAARFELARSIVSQLEKGKIYEFPEVVEHPERITAPVSDVPKPTEQMKALEGFIGEWTATRDEDASYKETVRYSWSNDGTALWRETGAVGAKYRGASRCSYDPIAKSYVEIACEQRLLPQQMLLDWDATRKSLAFSAERDVGPGKAAIKGSRTFESPDRIRWTSTSTASDGVPHVLSGYYTRVGKE